MQTSDEPVDGQLHFDDDTSDVVDRLIVLRCRKAVVWSSTACLAPIIWLGLALFEVIPLPWNASWPFVVNFVGGGLLTLVALILSIDAILHHRSWCTIGALILAILAIPIVLVSTMLVMAIGLANHPV